MSTMKNSEWQQRKAASFARGMGNMFPVFVDRGIAVVNTGHSHPDVVRALHQQLDAFSHSCIMVTPYPSAVELAEKLCKVAPIEEARAMFVSTGAEAVENAIKIARSSTGRTGIIAFSGGFHGRTNLCMGLTGKVVPYKKGFGPFTPDIYHVPFPAGYLGVDAEDSLRAVDELFKSDIEADKVAAIIVEPVQGEGGFYPVPEGFLADLRALCDRHGILLIVDEIQTGYARTGRMFAVEYAGIEPDIITVAKGIAGGFPIAAVVGRQAVMDGPEPGGLGGTYAGSPLGCAAALAVLDVIERERLCERALEVGERLVSGLRQLQSKYPERVGDIRSLGAMVAMELVQDGDPGKPDATLTKALCNKAVESGLILLSCGVRGNVIRILTPLTIDMAHVDEGLGILEAAFEACL
jgi:4-aminobutyrate aminotransferase/(S)-3-amino-2-methylpropionate transaminase